MDNIRSSTSSAARNIADTIDPSDSTKSSNDEKEPKTDGQGLPVQKGTFRDQLDRAAFDNVTKVEKEESNLQKAHLNSGHELLQYMNRALLIAEVMSYIPGIGTSEKPQSGTSQDQRNEGKGDELHTGAEPRRHDHDLQVEEFLKEHYKSTSKPKASDVELNGERE